MKTFLMPKIFRNKKEKSFFVMKDEFGGWIGYGDCEESYKTRISTLMYETFIRESKRNKKLYNTVLAASGRSRKTKIKLDKPFKICYDTIIN